MAYATHRRNIVLQNYDEEDLIRRHKKITQYLIKQGFTEYCANKYSTAVRILTANEIDEEKSGIDTVTMIRNYWQTGKDYQNPFPFGIYYGNYQFESIGGIARAIENFIRKRAEFDGPFNPNKTLYRGLSFARKSKYFKQLISLQVGKVVKTEMPFCTSSDRFIADTFICKQENSILMRFVGGFERTASVEDLTEVNSEHEVLLGRNSKLKLISKKIQEQIDHIDYIRQKETKPLYVLTFEEA